MRAGHDTTALEQAYGALGTALVPKLSLDSPEAIKRLVVMGATAWRSRRSIADELSAGKARPAAGNGSQDRA